MHELLRRPMAGRWRGGNRSPELVAVSDAAGLEIVRELGSGGMGVVYLARQRRLGRLVAVKLLRHGLAVDKELVERFVREAHTAAGLTHASIVGVIDFGQAKGVFYLVM
ncbi:MAG: protein kinase, partial [Actinobacteria bacterium]|nr:protein kinase [Actinomycetota bacterium]